MTEIQHLIEDLKSMHDGAPWHGPSLRPLLEGVTPAQAAAKPMPGAHSIWEIVLHLRGWQQVCLARLDGKERKEPEAGDFPAVAAASDPEWQRTLATLSDAQQQLIDKITSLTTQDLDRGIPGRNYDARHMLRGVIHHHIYHSGQIAMLRKFV
jgi:uncharacterized damage-inducible protein DinB